MKLAPAYRQLELAVNASVMSARIEEALSRAGRPAVLENLSIPRVFPRWDDSFTVQYRTKVARGETPGSQDLVLCGHLLGPDAHWPQYVENHQDSVIMIDNPRMVIPLFPFDPQLKALPKLATDVAARAVIAKCLPEASRGTANGKPSHEVLSYRMERRCVIRYGLVRNGQSLSAVAKLFRAKRAGGVRRACELLTANGIAVPRTYDFDQADGVHYMESVPGVSLHDLTESTSLATACEGAARLLSDLHRVPPEDLPRYAAHDEVRQLRAWVALTTRLYPDSSALFDEVLRRLQETVPDAPERMTCIHRDFYDKQILHSDEGLTLLDYDNLALGDPAQDYGNFVAHLRLRAEQSPSRAPNIFEARRSFEAAYDLGGVTFQVRSLWWEAATLARLAGLYSLRPRWRHLTNILIRKALSCIPTD